MASPHSSQQGWYPDCPWQLSYLESLEDQSYWKPPSQGSDSCRKGSLRLQSSQERTVLSVRNSSFLAPE